VNEDVAATREDQFGDDVGNEVLPPFGLSKQVIDAMAVFPLDGWEWNSLTGETQERFIHLCRLTGQLVKLYERAMNVPPKAANSNSIRYKRMREETGDLAAQAREAEQKLRVLLLDSGFPYPHNLVDFLDEWISAKIALEARTEAIDVQATQSHPEGETPAKDDVTRFGTTPARTEAETIAFLYELLDGRDNFIVEHGLWKEFTETLNESPPRSG